MQKCLLRQLGRNAHVYVDDVEVKTEKRGTLLEDLKETFENLRRFQIKLNPEKCVFGVPAGQLLGFLVSGRGIKCNPMKIKAIEMMKVPTRLLDLQKFTGCLASVSRFISRLGEKALPLYQLMKKSTFSSGTTRRTKHFSNSRRCWQPHLSWQLRLRRSPCSSTLQPPVGLSA